MVHNIWHRNQFLEKLLNQKRGSLQDVELLEILLGLAFPRQDTRALAKDMLAKYGSFAKVITAEKESLLTIEGVSLSVLACFRFIQESVERLSRTELVQKPVIGSWKSLIDYCRIAIGHLKKEVFIVLYLTSQNELLDEDRQEYGTVDQVTLYPREVAKRAIFLNASAIILVHNHPGGSTKASKADIQLTTEIITALAPFKIHIHDHIIISDKDFFSFKAAGLL